MYNDDLNEYDLERQRLRKKFKRRLRFRRFLAAFILLLIIALIGGGIWLLISKLVSNHKVSVFNATSYVYDKNALEVAVVDNVFTAAELKEYFGIEVEQPFDPFEKLEAEVKDTYVDTYVPSGDRSGLIIVDAGHGGKDSGTFNDLGLEKDINLEIAYWLKEELEHRGYTVYMTRTDDTYIGLQKRANLANEQNNPLAMVSIHQNSVEDFEEASGVEAWTYDRKGCRELAQCLVDEVSKASGANNRGVFYRTNLVVTSKTTMPSVIVECGYMSNTYDSAKLVDEDYQVSLARGIANALDAFIDSYY